MQIAVWSAPFHLRWVQRGLNAKPFFERVGHQATLKVSRMQNSLCLPLFHWETGRRYPTTRE